MLRHDGCCNGRDLRPCLRSIPRRPGKGSGTSAPLPYDGGKPGASRRGPECAVWEMLKIGTDAFVANGRPPTVAVCDQQYVFNPVATGDLDPNASCPPGIEPRLVSIVETQLPAVSTPANSPPGSPAPRVPQIGTFCYTQAGRFGPGLAQPLGSSCVANTPGDNLLVKSARNERPEKKSSVPQAVRFASQVLKRDTA